MLSFLDPDNMDNNKDRPAPALPDGFVDDSRDEYVQTQTDHDHLRWTEHTLHCSTDRVTSQIAEELHCFDPIPQPMVTPDSQTITRYALRLVAEGCTKFERLIRCDQPETAARFLHQVLEGADREVMGALYLDTQHHAVGYTIAYVGTLYEAPVEPRGVLVPALLANAAAMILFHNHPSGNPEPSRHDLNITSKLVEAGEIVGVKVLDHIILGEAPRYLSMFSRNPW